MQILNGLISKISIQWIYPPVISNKPISSWLATNSIGQISVTISVNKSDWHF